MSQNVKPLIWVECRVEKHSRSRIEYVVKARSQYKERSTASLVEVLLPLPPDAITPAVRTSQVQRSLMTLICVESQTLSAVMYSGVHAGRCGVCAGKGGVGVEDQKLPGRQGIPAALQV